MLVLAIKLNYYQGNYAFIL